MDTISLWEWEQLKNLIVLKNPLDRIWIMRKHKLVNQSVMGASHHTVVGMMGAAAQRGQVQLSIRRRQFQGERLIKNLI